MKEIPLTQGQVALVDDEDYESVIQHRWRAKYDPSCSAFYVYHNFWAMVEGRRVCKSIAMHRLIMDAPTGVHVDHKDGNPLNNQRTNLRLCSPKNNHRNRKKRVDNRHLYKGTCRELTTRGERWRARICKDGCMMTLGTFATEEEAARCYDAAARRLFGEFARCNFNGGAERQRTGQG